MFALVTVVGCSAEPEIAPFSGKVIYKDVPLEFGGVMLQPIAGGKPSVGRIQSDGTFTLTTRGVGPGAKIGINRVRVTAFESQRVGKAAPSSGVSEIPLGRTTIPSRYNSFGSSGMTVEVKAEGNEPYLIELED